MADFLLPYASLLISIHRSKGPLTHIPSYDEISKFLIEKYQLHSPFIALSITHSELCICNLCLIHTNLHLKCNFEALTKASHTPLFLLHFSLASPFADSKPLFDVWIRYRGRGPSPWASPANQKEIECARNNSLQNNGVWMAMGVTPLNHKTNGWKFEANPEVVMNFLVSNQNY